MASAAPASAAAARHLAHVLPPWAARDLAREYLRDDVPTFDIGGLVVGESEECAVLLAKSRAVLAGIPFFDAVFAELGCTVEWLKAEGDVVEPPTRVAYVRGKCRNLLLGERTALNILSRVSGVASLARKYADLKAAAGWHGEIAGTRKTTPGFRLAEKYGLLAGGCSTHRHDLSQMCMLKDNHVWACGGITAAVRAAKGAGGFSTKVEVEVRTLAEAEEACAAGCDVVMFDNYTPERMAEDAAALKARYPHVITEASGGITLATAASYFSPHIDVVSVGALTHGYAVADFSLKIMKGEGAATIAATEERLRAEAAAGATGRGPGATGGAGAP